MITVNPNNSFDLIVFAVILIVISVAIATGQK